MPLVTLLPNWVQVEIDTDEDHRRWPAPLRRT